MGNDGELKRMDEVITFNNVVLDGALLKKIFTSEFFNAEHNAYKTYKIAAPVGNSSFFSNDNALINTVVVRYSYLQSALKENNGTTDLEMKRCKQLIGEIEKEYNMENE